MSGFSSAALPGKIPTAGPGRFLTPELLMSPASGTSGDPAPWLRKIEVKSVKVCLFDLSDEVQRKKYERLQAKLIDGVYKGKIMVEDSRKDLVHRADGTSYWMKYVEYIELDKPGSSEKAGGER